MGSALDCRAHRYMETAPTERRSAPRFAVVVPVMLTVGDSVTKRTHEESGCTRDASSKGVYIYADTAIPEGTQFEFTLFLPSDYPGVRYQARVVRVEPLDDGSFGIAAVTRFIGFLSP